MEIVFNDVTYKENVKTPLEKTYLKKVSFMIEDNKITSIIGNTSSGIDVIGDLISIIKTPTSGSIRVFEYVNDGRRIKNINKLRMNIGYVKSDVDKMLFNKTVKDELSFGVKYFKYKINKQEIRVKEALKLVNLDEEYLNKNVNDLTFEEKKKVSLASVLIFNPSLIILEDITIGLSNKEKDNLLKLLNTLKSKYKKTIILISKDTDFCYRVTDKVFIIDHGRVVFNGDRNVLIHDKMLTFYDLETPNIVKFINAANKKNKNLTYTTNILDLIKEVYRNAK
mgnify:FL=1